MILLILEVWAWLISQHMPLAALFLFPAADLSKDSHESTFPFWNLLFSLDMIILSPHSNTMDSSLYPEVEVFPIALVTRCSKLWLSSLLPLSHYALTIALPSNYYFS